MQFIKMHGCGNDYVYLDCFQSSEPEQSAELARAMSDRHKGVGADGLILLLPGDHGDARMRMFNADGSESEMCGNGLRCVAALAANRGYLSGLQAAFDTGAGLLPVTCHADADGLCRSVTVDMGAPRLQAPDVPVLGKAAAHGAVEVTLRAEEHQFTGVCVGMGNPHCVIFVDDAESIPLETLGPIFEHDQQFPNRCNIEWVSMLGPNSIRQRTWERGSGITQACGTGACAVAAAAMLTGRVPYGTVTIQLDGGDLSIDWDGSGSIHMTGEAIEVFTGEWPNG